MCFKCYKVLIFQFVFRMLKNGERGSGVQAQRTGKWEQNLELKI